MNQWGFNQATRTFGNFSILEMQTFVFFVFKDDLKWSLPVEQTERTKLCVPLSFMADGAACKQTASFFYSKPWVEPPAP